MFERFTDRARRVVVLSQEEARLLGHDYIGTEHILLGLVREGDGVAAQVLEALGVDLANVRRKVEEIIGERVERPSGHIPFTPRSKKVLELSLREALQLGHNYIGTEHLLLGLVREGEGVAAQVLVVLGADLSVVRHKVIEVLAGGAPGAAEPMATPYARRARLLAGTRAAARVAPARVRAGEMLERSIDRIVFRRFTVSASRVLLLAESEAMRLGHPDVRVAHLLLGLAVEGEGRGARALAAAGVDLGRARSAVERALGTTPGTGGRIDGYADDLLAAIEWALFEALASGGGGAGGGRGGAGTGGGERHEGAREVRPAGSSEEQIDTEQLLLGVLSRAEAHDGVADAVLAALDVSPADVRRALGELPPDAPATPVDESSDQGGPAGKEGGEGDDEPGAGASDAAE
jgi:ATP-dependent Clp protease ATP-binding subunit ClpA